ncbi:hypothetical protein CC1G_01541 [Coprinopsis cinerea okayama7|uniref:Pheromone receptor n=1 Tax=Coprinopsis cinerea (strain Okayama-7 / 130 / ATCC MYA-4618 / FGSC 9003) TaxID=240176 RepID=A8NHZ2_COPC7|nr:hypothetical protein CC1G_01541 [Coprinopsis cinerea okayama7\|eukprot:XP_001833864.2 hypothetical protein CC1G_01541 [Coprinopsis cinerea okayama7\
MAVDLDIFGGVMARTFFANSTVTFMDVGIQLFMCLYGLSVFLETPKDLRSGRIPYIVVSFVIFALSALTAVVDMYDIFRCLFEATSPRDFYLVWDKYADSYLRVLSLASLSVFIWVADGLMLYRCYIMWADQWWFLILPGLTYLGSIGMGMRMIVPAPIQGSRLSGSVFAFLAIALNIMVTGLISFRLIRARKHFAQVIPERNLNLYNGIVAILIESALPLALFGIGHAVALIITPGSTTESASNWQIALSTFSLLYYSFTALSPQMIIFRVTTGRSWLTPLNAATATAMSKPLVFDHGPTEQSFLASVRPQRDEEEQISNGSETPTSEKR